MSKNTDETIAGRSIRILVSEPWDFSFSDGDNLLKGRVILESPPGAQPGWLLLEVTPFPWDGSVARHLIATTRYENKAAPARELRSNGRVTCNLAVPALTGDPTPEEVRHLIAIPTGARFIMIGSVEL